MSLLVNRLERNLIRLARQGTPESVGDPQFIEAEKNRFINFYKSRPAKK